MEIKKYTQDEVNGTLWRACDTFRGKIDSSIYKDYVLVMLFVKYISDIYKEHKEAYMEKYNNDSVMVQRQMGYERFVLDEISTFDYIYEKRNASNIGSIINIALSHVEEENKAKLRGVFKNIDFNSEAVLGNTKERNAMLKTLLEDFKDLDLRPSRLIEEDVIGNAYEYMIANFASDAGKKGGEFFTPSEVSELLSRLVKPEENDRIYDPTCGSGSLLIKAFKKIPSGKAQIYGQERNGQTQSLARMNMFLHNIDDAKIAWGDTLSNPLHLENDKLMKFQVIVANPPFSLDKWAMGFAGEGTDKEFKMEEGNDPYKRFSFGVPPKSKGDYAFVLHMIHSLAEGGRMATVLPHGVLFRGGSEERIRRKLIEMNLLDAVIGLPANLFFGVSIPVCVLVFKQNRSRNDILFINASGEGFYEKEKNQNKLREIDIQRIFNVYEKYESVDRFSYVVTIDELKENEYNLNIPRYVDTFIEEEMVDMGILNINIAKIKAEITEIEEKMAKHLKNLGL